MDHPHAKGLVLMPPPKGAHGFDLVIQGKAVPVQRFYRTGSILDQGQKPMCGGYAAYQLLQSEPIPQKVSTPEGIYRKARTLDGLPKGTEGTTIAGVVAALRAMKAVDNSYVAYSVDHVFKYVATISPVLIGSEWTTKMDTPSGDGRIRSTGDNTGGHAYLCHGVDFETKRLYFTNSWGKSWGNDGTCWMTFADFTKLFNRSGSAAAVREIRND